MKTTPAFRRLSVAFLVLAAATGLAGYRGVTQAASGDAGKTVPYMPNFIVGADISAVPTSEARGVKFSDNGVQKDILQILKDHGFNYIRLRIFVEPTNQGGYSAQGYCGLAKTIPMARRVKEAGMGLLLDFHYSDTWADPGKQTKPLAWREMPPEQLVKTVHDYTLDVITRLKTAGGEPDMVQIGNEITPGMLLNAMPGGRGGGGARTVSTQPEGSTAIGTCWLRCSRRASPAQGGGPEDSHRAPHRQGRRQRRLAQLGGRGAGARRVFRHSW